MSLGLLRGFLVTAVNRCFLAEAPAGDGKKKRRNRKKKSGSVESSSSESSINVQVEDITQAADREPSPSGSIESVGSSTNSGSSVCLLLSVSSVFFNAKTRSTFRLQARHDESTKM